MHDTLLQRCRKLDSEGPDNGLSGSKIGLEKESLRVAAEGGIAQTSHPEALGSPLTHPYITTDFSEALTEMITPPCDSVDEALDYLADIEKFVCMNIQNEIMWKSSMPCVVEGGDSIPIAQYGDSNIGKMKTIYRRGLGYRYGRTMQVIAGVHFNYSFSDPFWELYKQQEGDAQPTSTFKSERYMGLVRNVLRCGWLIPYLFGASPAVCKSFLHGKRTMLSSFSRGTAYEEYATSLRMGDIGYTNNKEDLAGIKAVYDDVDAYVESLSSAIRTPYAEYEAIGVKSEGEYRQLSANILQIENEYYSTVRPKQIPEKNEMPIYALRDRGVEYVELRSLDIDVFEPLGVNRDQLFFLETFMLYCLLQDSPPLNDSEMNEIDINLISVAHDGRKPSLMLYRDDTPVSLKEWATTVFEAMRPVADLLDHANQCDDYSNSLERMSERVGDFSKTPSARILQAMREHGEEYFHFAKRMALKHQETFRQRELSEEKVERFRKKTAESILDQQSVEAGDDVDFDAFLERYYAQS